MTDHTEAVGHACLRDHAMVEAAMGAIQRGLGQDVGEAGRFLYSLNHKNIQDYRAGIKAIPFHGVFSRDSMWLTLNLAAGV